MIFTDRNKLHLGGDDALTGVPELRDGMAGAGTERFAFRALEMVEAVFALGLAGEFFVAPREVAVVFRFDLAAIVLGNVPSPADPCLAQGRDTFARVAGKFRVAPWAAGVVDADRLVRLELAVEIFRRREADLAERDADFGMDFAFDVDALRIGHHVVGGFGFEGVFGCDHERNTN